jgi:hypothetical protein
MIEIVFRERQSLTDVARVRLSQGVIPTFHVTGLPRFLADTAMRFFRKNFLVGFPEVTKRVTRFIRFRDQLPESATRRYASITDDMGHDLPGAPTQGGPESALFTLFQDK